MKKLLALVLALVMTMGLATVGTNAAFTDQEKVDANDFSEAINVLGGMGILKGDENGNFNPDAYIDRASTAAMIYRLYTGDVADAQAGIYAGYGHFTDLALDWYKGYIGFCANSEFIYGDGEGHFYPNKQVTGYQVLAMVLRAIGYNKENDFTGDDWELQVANAAHRRGLVQNVSATTLKQPATRALVAEIIWEACWVVTVVHSPLLGYSIYQNSGVGGGIQGQQMNPTLGWANFRLCWYTTNDAWGRPAYGYGYDADGDNRADGSYWGTSYEPTLTYTEAVAECEVIHDLGIGDNNWTANVWVNANDRGQTVINRLNTNVYIGAQGRLTEVYNIPAQQMKFDQAPINADNTWKNAVRRIVVIDTFLAQVTKVTARVDDHNGHMVTPSIMDLDIFVGGRPGITPVANQVVISRQAASTKNWTYAVGDYILLQAQTNGTDALRINNGNAVLGNQAFLNLAGSANDFACTRYTDGVVNALRINRGVVLGKAESFVGAQTVLGYNTGKHTIDGKVYPDALEYHKDDALNTITKYNWFLDKYGNIIGSAVIDTIYSYGVITSIWWVPDNTTGGGHAEATVTYMDGTNATVSIASIKLQGVDENGDAMDDTLTPWRQLTAGTEMRPQLINATPIIPISTFANANAVADATVYNDGRTEPQQFLGRDLFRLAQTANGAYAAEEVGSTGFLNSGATRTAFNKALANNNGVVTNDNTVFLVSLGNGLFASYKGRSNLPANYALDEIDWVRVDGDQYADYVFIRAGANVRDNVTTFYLTSPVYTWELNAAGTAILNYKLTGFINGVEGTLTIPAILPGDGGNGQALVTRIIATWGQGTAVVLATRNNVVQRQVLNAAQFVNADGAVYQLDADTQIMFFQGNVGDTWNGNVYCNNQAGGALYFTGASVTPLVGTWSADMSGKNVVLVVKTTGGVRHITQAYIYDRGVNPWNPNPVVPNSRQATVTWTVTITNRINATQTQVQINATITGTEPTYSVSASTAAQAALTQMGYNAEMYTLALAAFVIDGVNVANYNVVNGAAINGVISILVG